MQEELHCVGKNGALIVALPAIVVGSVTAGVTILARSVGSKLNGPQETVREANEAEFGQEDAVKREFSQDRWLSAN